VSISIAKIATYIKGFTGAITARKDEQIKSNLVFIFQKVVVLASVRKESSQGF
jgi:hypothetical protein